MICHKTQPINQPADQPDLFPMVVVSPRNKVSCVLATQRQEELSVNN